MPLRDPRDPKQRTAAQKEVLRLLAMGRCLFRSRYQLGTVRRGDATEPVIRESGDFCIDGMSDRWFQARTVQPLIDAGLIEAVPLTSATRQDYRLAPAPAATAEPAAGGVR